METPIATNIRAALERSGHSQNWLAAQVGVSPAAVHKWVNGKAAVDAAHLAPVADALGLRLADLLPEGHRTARAVVQHEANGMSVALIPQVLGARLSSGVGPTPVPPVAMPVPFSRGWLEARGLDPATLEVWRVAGDSMAPYIGDGDAILVDTAPTRPASGEVWALEMPGTAGLRVKRLFVRDNGDVVLRSDNTDKALYPDEVITSASPVQIHLIGRVVWRGSH